MWVMAVGEGWTPLVVHSYSDRVCKCQATSRRFLC